MIAAIRSQFGRLHRDEGGFALPEVIVSIIISSVSITIIATAVVTFLALQGSVNIAGKSVGEMTSSDAAWRSDAQGATIIAATDSTQVVFTVPNADGSCRQSTWTVQTRAAAMQVVRSIINFPALNSDTSACTGTPAPAIVQTAVSDASVGAGFQFKNRVGRGITFTAGTPTLAAGATPSWTTDARWNDPSIGATTLVATGSASSGHPMSIFVSQIATSVFAPTPPASTTGTPDAGTSHAN
jgi:hypothetical protein